MQTIPVDLCYNQPLRYKLCDKDNCIPKRFECPCKVDSEFKCALGNCIPIELKCDGLKQCVYGEDERFCPMDDRGKEEMEVSTVTVTRNPKVAVKTSEEMRLSIPVVVTIASVCVFVCVLLVFLFYVCIAKRQKNNTSRESQSATEPLRKSYITSDLEAADGPNERDIYKQLAHAPKERAIPERLDYIPVEAASDNEKYHPSNYIPVQRRGNNDEYHPVDYKINMNDIDDHVEAKSNDTEHIHDKCKENMAIKPGVEIYNVDPPDPYKVSGLGKYTFKPRLKYMATKPYLEIDEKDREQLYVINSYRHCSGKSILPSTLTFDKDPEKFSDKFATDLLCSSTPKPEIKHSSKHERSRSKESIADHTDNDLEP